MISITNCYWKQNVNIYIVIISTRNIVRPCRDVSVIEDVTDISSIVCNKKQARQYFQRHPIFISDADHNYILYEIVCHDNIEYER